MLLALTLATGALTVVAWGVSRVKLHNLIRPDWSQHKRLFASPSEDQHYGRTQQYALRGAPPGDYYFGQSSYIVWPIVILVYVDDNFTDLCQLHIECLEEGCHQHNPTICEAKEPPKPNTA